jgi:hypothetical protein
MLGGGRRGGSNANQNSDSQSAQQPQNQSSKGLEKPAALTDELTYEQFQARLDTFSRDLSLTSSQEDAWKRFSDKATTYFGLVVRDRAHTQNVKSGANPALDGLKLLEQLSDSAKTQSKALDDLNIAGKNLYKVLTSEQKAIADKSIGKILGPKASGQVGYQNNPISESGSSVVNSVYKGPLTTSNSDAKVQIPGFSDTKSPSPDDSKDAVSTSH